jgi:uncharacterized protein
MNRKGNSLTKPGLLNIIFGVEFGVINLLQLDVARLKRSPGDCVHYDLTADIPPLEFSGEDITFAEPVKAVLDLINTGKLILVEGIVSGNLELCCSRCLKTFIYKFEVPIDEKYTMAPERKNEEILTFTGDFIDITPEVVSSIYLALPMKAICSDDCSGLCPVCGCNLNENSCKCDTGDIDPRLRVLKDLLDNKD